MTPEAFGRLVWPDAGGAPGLVSGSGRTALDGLWPGYRVLSGSDVRLRWLREDRAGARIALLAPAADCPPGPDRVEVYFLHRLREQLVSLFGHLAIAVRGRVWNFSAVLEENEAVSWDEYFYRPQTGPFVRHADGHGLARVDRYGRRFMRAADVLSLEGLPAERLADVLDGLLDEVRAAAEKAQDGSSPAFSSWSRNCAGFIREALNESGVGSFSSHAPRDLFVELAWHFRKRGGATFRRVPQLIVPGILPSSSAVPLLRPANWCHALRLGTLAGR